MYVVRLFTPSAELAAAMQTLSQTLERISRETGEGQQGAATTGKGGDEFKRLKTKIATELKTVRQKLKEREDLLAKGASGTKATVQTSHMIRQLLKDIRDDANRLMTLQRKEAARVGKNKERLEQASTRQETVELVFKHIEECELQEKKRYTSKNADARVELFSGGGKVALGGGVYPSCTGGGGTSGGGTSGTRGAGPSGGGGGVGGVAGLPEIDDETQEGLQMLERKNEAIDQQLDVVAEGVQELKSIALHMRDEVKVQSAMVDEITHKVDSAGAQLSNLNRKMKKTLAQTRSADRFILDFILLVVLLAIIGYIISLATGGGR